MPGLGRARRSTRRFTRPSPRLCARRGWTLAGEPLSTPRRTTLRNDRRVVPFCALPTVTPRISWPVASRWWEVLSDAAPGQSSNTVRCSSSNQTGPPNSWEYATWPGSPRTLAFGLDLSRRRLPGRWSSSRSHAICPPPSAAGPPSWKKTFIGSPPGQDGAELCHTKLDGRATFKKEQPKRCVPRIRRRQVCPGSWNSETFSYNEGERLGGNLLQNTLDFELRPISGPRGSRLRVRLLLLVAPFRDKLDGQANVRARERGAFLRGSIPWYEMTLVMIVVDRKGQDGFHEHESAVDCRPRQARREGDPPGWPQVQDRPR